MLLPLSLSLFLSLSRLLFALALIFVLNIQITAAWRLLSSGIRTAQIGSLRRMEKIIDGKPKEHPFGNPFTGETSI